MRRRLACVGWPGLLGLALLLAGVAWAVTVAVRFDQGLSATTPYAIAPVVLAGGIVAGLALQEYAGDSRLHVAFALAAGILVLGVPFTVEPGKAPLGYANANAALTVQLVALSGLALLATPRGRRRMLFGAVTLGVVAVALNRSVAGLAVALPVVAVIASVVWRRPRHGWWAVLVGTLVASAGAAVILRLAEGPEFPTWARGIFDTVREQLWHDAVALWQERPVTGSGPGSFRDATALSVDPDTSTAHSSVLQIGAETGWVGVALFGLVALAGLLLAARGRAPQCVVAAAAWTALLVHSYADHLLEFAPVVFAAGLVLGWAAATRPSEELDVAEGERPVAG